jgi:UDP-N-acetylmuramate dehydrogenase
LEFLPDLSLRNYNTLRLDVRAQWFCRITNEPDLGEAIEFARTRNLPITVLGEGSNVVLLNHLAGLVVQNGIKGVSFDGGRVLAAAGENWHGLVQQAVQRKLGGIENLALIPGTVGAAPIQNIGAYGVELSDIFSSLKAIHSLTGETAEFSASDCQFAYRDSLFKHERHWIVSSIALQLLPDSKTTSHYPTLASYLQDRAITATVESVFHAVSEIRRTRLPDPAVEPNVGSFFKNPLVDAAVAKELRRSFPEMPVFEVVEGCKLSAAWLIDQAGLKGFNIGDICVSEKHALVIINQGDGSPEELVGVIREVQSLVAERYHVDLEVEPQIYE